MSEKTWEMPDGIFTALVTPFNGDQVDRKAWTRLVQRQIDGGVAGVVPVGCTGEAATLSGAWPRACGGTRNPGASGGVGCRSSIAGR